MPWKEPQGLQGSHSFHSAWSPGWRGLGIRPPRIRVFFSLAGLGGAPSPFMRSLPFLLAVLAACLIPLSSSYGALHAVTVNGTVFYENPNATNPRVSGSSVNDTSIIEYSLANSGTSGAFTRSNTELAFDDDANAIELVSKADGTVLFVFAQEGESYAENGGLDQALKKGDLDTLVGSDWEMPSPFGDIAICTVLEHVTVVSDNVTSATGSFTGATDESVDVPCVIQATFKTGKVLNFTN